MDPRGRNGYIKFTKPEKFKRMIKKFWWGTGMSFIEEGKGSYMIYLHKRTLSNKTQCVASHGAGGWAISNCRGPVCFSLKFLTWQNFRKHNCSEINERRSKVREYSLKVKKTHSKLRGFFWWGVECWGWILGLMKVGQAHWATPVTPTELQVELTYIWFLLYRWYKLYMMEPPWSSVREAMSSTPSSFMGCIAVTFWWVIVLCL